MHLLSLPKMTKLLAITTGLAFFVRLAWAVGTWAGGDIERSAVHIADWLSSQARDDSQMPVTADSVASSYYASLFWICMWTIFGMSLSAAAWISKARSAEFWLLSVSVVFFVGWYLTDRGFSVGLLAGLTLKLEIGLRMEEAFPYLVFDGCYLFLFLFVACYAIWALLHKNRTAFTG